MPTLENDRLVFRFPQVEENASLAIDFQRTLRIPDSEKTYPLPPGLGSFPLRHVEDFAERLPATTVSRGGVILPIWQAEAMWLRFHNEGPDWGLAFPVAIKVAAGKINAVTGERWRSGLNTEPQDYMVSPRQPWLDGFAIEKGVIRQFVAMPLGAGYSVEEQLTAEAEWGGLQISVVPLKTKAWKAYRQACEVRQQRMRERPVFLCRSQSAVSMGLAAGGRMRQVIYPDSFDMEDWDVAAADRVFVSLTHAKDWKTITGNPAPNEPPSAKDYSSAGLPWFEHYGEDQVALPGSTTLAGLSSLATIFKKKTGAKLPNAEDVSTGTPRAIGPGAKGPRMVRNSSSWET